MLSFEALVASTMMALAYSRVRRREWLSSTIVIFVLVLCAVGEGPVFRNILVGDTVGLVARVCLVWFALVVGYSSLRTWEDLKNPPDKGSPGRGRRNPIH